MTQEEEESAMPPEFEFERREEVVKKTYVTIDGEEFDSDIVFDFLRSVMGTDGFMSYVVADYHEQAFADFLRERDIIGKKANGGLYEKENRCSDLCYRLEDRYVERFIDE